MKKIGIKFPFIVIFFLILHGCVGTVQEATPPNTFEQTNPPSTFAFSGIVSAKAVSHNKVEIEFAPMNSSDYTYYLFINNSQTPITIDAKSMLPLVNGRSLYTVTGLNTNQEYKFKVTAENKKNATISTGENEVFVRTFDNVVADFVGISKVSLVAGDTDGAILVNWISPVMSGIFTSGPFDPVYYEVSIISEIGGVGNLNNPTYSGTDKKVVLVPSPPMRASPLSNPSGTVIDSLAPNTRYFVQVRAINALYRDLFEDPDVVTIPVSRETNNRYMVIKTEPGGELFDFRQDNVVLANASGMDAFDKIDVFWQPGSGSFSSYRIFVRKYDGSGDPKTDDKLTETEMISKTLASDYITVSSSLTNKRISGLESNAHYQVKVVLCKIASCPVAAVDPDAAIISDLETIQVKPTLAPFGGINLIDAPSSYTAKDEVNLKFDAPLVNSGFANALEFYCVDPNNFANQVAFTGTTPLNGTGIPVCEGLYLTGTPPSLEVYTSQKVKGLAVTNGTKKYCFSATPAIVGLGPEIRLSSAERIVRCSYPEVIPPTVAQFPGLSGTCGVGGTTASVAWPAPTGGVYSGFKVFWKEKSSSSKFSFSEAITGAAGYNTSAVLPTTQVNYVATGLTPGRTYQIGVLAHVDLSPSPSLYSEYNLKVQECTIPLPIATFKGFTRIFALGPKLDGRIPQNVNEAPSDEAKIYEAIDANGIPYEVGMLSVTTPDLSTNYTAPPGRDFGNSFSAPFDGIGDPVNNYGMSRDGIVSLAWEEVGMNFPEADTIFATNQPAAPASRSSRTYGYKVYRSSDNKLTLAGTNDHQRSYL